MAEEITYDTLRNRQKQEDDQPGLTRFEPDFYRRVRQGLSELREEYRKAHDEDPSQRRTRMLLDEIEKMEDTLTDLYQLRERKIVQAAVATSRGGNPDVDNLTPVEEDLFRSLVRTLDEHKVRTLDGDDAEASGDAPEDPKEDAPPSEGPPDDPAPDDPSDPREHGEDDEADREAAAVERVLVRALEDLEPFVATDMETYELAEDDVANLPKEQARVLCRRGKAVEIQDAS